MTSPVFRSGTSFLALVLVAGAVLLLPSLGMGFLLDDTIYLADLDGQPVLRIAPADLFRFIPGDAAENRGWIADGCLPWWTAPDLRLGFWRPLSSALMRLDHALFGRAAWAWHAHSIAWFLALLVAWRLFLRRAVPGPAGALALLLCAIGVSHALPAGWISNRNALVAALPAFLGLVAHLRWREEGWRPGLPLSLLGYAAGLAGGEAAIGALAYLLAYEVLAGPGPLRRRAGALAPAVLLVVGYLVAYRALGYGAVHSGLYFDPMGDPAGFLRELPARLGALLGGGIAAFPADLWFYGGEIRTVQVIVGALAVCLFLLLFHGLPAGERRPLRWLVAGAILSLLPAAATFPSDRMLLVASPGLGAAVAAILVHARRAWRERGPRWRRAVAGGAFLALVHLFLSPVQLLAFQGTLIVQRRAAEAAALEAELDPGAPAGSQDVVVLAAPDHLAGIYLPAVRWLQGALAPRSWRVLSLARCDHVCTRRDERTLELATRGGRMMDTPFDLLYRSSRLPFRRGDIVEAGLFRVEVLETDGVGPTRVSFRFDRPLEDPSIVFLSWREGRLCRTSMPAVGGTLDIPWTIGPAGM